MEKFILILLIIASVFIIRYFYKKTRSITCMRCGRITNLLHSRTYNGEHICDECFKQQTSINNNTSNNHNTYNNTYNNNNNYNNNNTYNTGKTFTADNIYTTDKTTDKDRFSNNSATFYSKNISNNGDTVTINIKSNQIYTDDNFTSFNNMNQFDKNKNIETFQPTYEIQNFIAVNENNKTWSLYPFKQIFKYSDLEDYSIQESTRNINIPSINIDDNVYEKLNDSLKKNKMNLDMPDIDDFFSINNTETLINQITLTVVLKNSNSITVSYASDKQNNDSSLNDEVKEITSLLESIKNNA